MPLAFSSLVDPRWLVALLTLFWMVTFPFILKRDLVFGVAYAMLFVYTIFTQVGYIAFPQLSFAAGLYRGEAIFYRYWLFVFVSFVLTAVLFAALAPRHRVRYTLCRTAHPELGQMALNGLVVGYNVLLLCGFVVFQNSLGYSMRANEVGTPLQALLFLFQWHKVLILVLYGKVRILRTGAQSHASPADVVLLVLTAVLHVLFALRVGARGELAFLFIGLSVAEFTKAHGIKLRHLRVLSPLVVLLGYGLSVLEYSRSVDPSVTVGAFLTNLSRPSAVLGMRESAAVQFVANDYMWPSHLLITAMDRNEVEPGAVFKSNAANSLMGIHYPYLSEVLSRGVSNAVDRINGFAFYIFIEGYVAAGWWGVFYNAVLFNLMFGIWRMLGSSSNHLFNSAAAGLLATFAPAVVRAQSSWFLKDTWLFVLPGLVLLMLASGLRLQWKRGA